MDERLKEIREAGPTAAFMLRGAPAVAVLLEAGADVPRSAFAAQRPLVAVYGIDSPGDSDGLGLLGQLETAKLERHPRGRGTRIRIYPDAPWTRLSGEQVARLIDLARDTAPAPGPRSRASALSNDNPSFKRLTPALA